jgi:hypothetical protein
VPADQFWNGAIVRIFNTALSSNKSWGYTSPDTIQEL